MARTRTRSKRSNLLRYGVPAGVGLGALYLLTRPAAAATAPQPAPRPAPRPAPGPAPVLPDGGRPPRVIEEQIATTQLPGAFTPFFNQRQVPATGGLGYTSYVPPMGWENGHTSIGQLQRRAVTRSPLPLVDAASSTARVLGTVPAGAELDVVETGLGRAPGSQAEWWYVRTPSGGTAFVRAVEPSGQTNLAMFTTSAAPAVPKQIGPKRPPQPIKQIGRRPTASTYVERAMAARRAGEPLEAVRALEASAQAAGAVRYGRFSSCRDSCAIRTIDGRSVAVTGSVFGEWLVPAEGIAYVRWSSSPFDAGYEGWTEIA